MYRCRFPPPRVAAVAWPYSESRQSPHFAFQMAGWRISQLFGLCLKLPLILVTGGCSQTSYIISMVPRPSSKPASHTWMPTAHLAVSALARPGPELAADAREDIVPHRIYALICLLSQRPMGDLGSQVRLTPHASASRSPLPYLGL